MLKRPLAWLRKHRKERSGSGYRLVSPALTKRALTTTSVTTNPQALTNQLEMLAASKWNDYKLFVLDQHPRWWTAWDWYYHMGYLRPYDQRPSQLRNKCCWLAPEKDGHSTSKTCQWVFIFLFDLQRTPTVMSSTPASGHGLWPQPRYWLPSQSWTRTVAGLINNEP